MPWDICAALMKVLLPPLWLSPGDMRSLAMAPGPGVGADMLLTVYFSKSTRWDGLQAHFLERARAAQFRAVGAAARF